MSASMSLAMAGEVSDCVVREVRGATWASSRLREMGFVERAKIKVLKIDGRGLIVGVNGTRFALSRGARQQDHSLLIDEGHEEHSNRVDKEP